MTGFPFHSLAEVVQGWAQREPQKQTLIFLAANGRPDRVITYGRLHADAVSQARALQALGIAPGDLVVLAFDHSYELIAAFLGAVYLGAVPTIVPYFTPHSMSDVYRGRVQALVGHTAARAVVTTPELRDDLAGVLAETGCAVMGVQAGPADEAAPTPAAFPIHRADSQDAAFVQFSSGTTGQPKGIVMSHGALLNQLWGVYQHFRVTEEDVVVGWGPFYHEMGLIFQTLLPLAIGGLSVLISPAHWVRRPSLLLRAIHEYRGTVTVTPNFGLNHCVRGIRERDLAGLDLSCLRMVVCTSELIRPDSQQRFSAHLAPAGFCPEALIVAYGLGECIMDVTRTAPGRRVAVDWVSVARLQESRRAVPVPAEEPGATPVVSCGSVLPGQEIAIVDEAGSRLPERQVGEVIVRGNSLFSGYHRQPDLTAQVMRGGWLYTGDLGYLAEGELYICDRKKDLIIVGGQNIYPDSIETTAQDTLGPRAGRAVAFGLRDEALGTEVPVLVCEYRGQLDEAEREQLVRRIRQRVQQELGVALADVRFVDKGWVIVTTSLKLARSANRQKYLDASFAPPVFGAELPASMEELERQLVEVFEETLGIRPIGPQDDFRTLGLDSIQLVHLFTRIERRFGRRLPLEAVLERPTIERIARLLTQPDAPPVSPAAKRPARSRRSLSALLKAAAHPRRTLLRLWRNGPRIADHTLPYAIGVRLLAWICARSWVRDRWYRQPIQQVRQFRPLVNDSLDEAEVVQHSLVRHSWKNWRVAALANCPAAEFGRWVTITGLDRVHASLNAGRGVVLLNSHLGVPAVISLLFSNLGTDDVMNVGGGRWKLVPAGWADLRSKTLLDRKMPWRDRLMAQLFEGQRTLERGGVLNIAADGYGGTSGLVIPFFGRDRLFRVGFAELVVTTGATVIPTRTTLDVAGYIKVEFLEPLVATGTSHREQVESLLRQYAGLLEGWWRQSPGDVPWNEIQKFLALPPASQAQRSGPT
jgi:fatty-acyl-CoA synthase